jgi:hypothetical protein
MNCAWLGILLAFLSQAPVEPSEAFRANYAGIKVDFDFTVKRGTLVDRQEEIWNGCVDTLFQHQDTRVGDLEGHWACDGVAESVRFSSTAERLANAAQQARLVIAQPGNADVAVVRERVFYVPLTECLWDGETLVSAAMPRTIDPRADDSVPRDLTARFPGNELNPLTSGRGPFYWGFTDAFPHILLGTFRDRRVEKSVRVLGGKRVIVEVYRVGEPGLNAPGICNQLEVAYDPAAGYLPRFARRIDYSFKPHTTALVKEMYLSATRVCAAGGTVPIDWIGAVYAVPEFDVAFPEYRALDKLIAPKKLWEHFHASNFQDRTAPVEITHFRAIRSIATADGVVPVPPDAGRLTLARIKAIANAGVKTPPKQP